MIKSSIYASFYTFLIISLRKISRNPVTESNYSVIYYTVIILWCVIKLKCHPIPLYSFSLYAMQTLYFSLYLYIGRRNSILSVIRRKHWMPVAGLYMLFHLILTTVLCNRVKWCISKVSVIGVYSWKLDIFQQVPEIYKYVWKYNNNGYHFLNT